MARFPASLLTLEVRLSGSVALTAKAPSFVRSRQADCVLSACLSWHSAKSASEVFEEEELGWVGTGRERPGEERDQPVSQPAFRGK